jgi:hypothetical protein
MKGSSLLWLLIFAVVFFFLGFFVQKFAARDSDPSPPSYLERLTAELGLDDDQQERIRTLLEDEDRAIREILDGEHGQEIRHRISEVRENISRQMGAVLTEDQKKRFTGLGPAPDPLEMDK